MRVLVTGSRDWEDWEAIITELDALAGELPVGVSMTVVHGACPRGADAMAADWCQQLTWWYDNIGRTISQEAHPADWGRHGKRAGFVRNAEMVALGADVCLAFIRNGSKGASMTADLAEKAGISTRRFYAA